MSSKTFSSICEARFQVLSWAHPSIVPYIPIRWSSYIPTTATLAWHWLNGQGRVAQHPNWHFQQSSMSRKENPLHIQENTRKSFPKSISKIMKRVGVSYFWATVRHKRPAIWLTTMWIHTTLRPTKSLNFSGKIWSSDFCVFPSLLGPFLTFSDPFRPLRTS